MSPQKNNTHAPLVWAEVNLGALRHNLRVIRSHISRSTDILAIVKADAYGHGMLPVAETLKKEGVRFFGVASIEEATVLRKVCLSERILVLGTFHRTQISSYVRHRIIPTVSSIEDAELLNAAGSRIKRKIAVHVKVDTGMGRLGVWYEEADYFFHALHAMKWIDVEGVYTHFARADHEDKTFTEKQITRFGHVVQKIRGIGFSPKYVHAANSMGLAGFRKAHLNLVRPGIILYGISPAKNIPLPRALRPILTLKTRVSFLKEVGKGTPISYQGTYETPGKTWIATLPVGYSHGYRIAFSNKASVQIRGKVYPVVGRVTMDQTLVNLGPKTPITRWEEVELIGSNSAAANSAQNLALLAQTIPYEILCSLHTKIPRHYNDR